MERVGNYYGHVKTRESGDGRTLFHYVGPWDQIVKASHVLCEDGKERVIYLREPDTFFSTPGRTQALGKTISGFISYDDTLERWTFKATGKYRDLLTGPES